MLQVNYSQIFITSPGHKISPGFTLKLLWDNIENIKALKFQQIRPQHKRSVYGGFGLKIDCLFFQDAAFFKKWVFSMWNAKDCFVFNSFLRKQVGKNLVKWGQKWTNQLRNISIWKWIPLLAYKTLNRAIYF